MSAGFEAYTDAGILQFSSEDLHFFWRSSGTTTSVSRTVGNTTPSTFDIPVPSSYNNPFVVVRCASLAGFVFAFLSGSNRIHRYACAGPIGTAVQYQIYDTSDALTPVGNSGLETYTATGALAWSSNLKPARIVSFPGSGTTNLPTGRTYMNLQSVSFAGNRTAGAQLAYLGGVLVPNPEDYGPTTVFNWRHPQNAKVQGCSISGNTVTVGNISFDDVTVIDGDGTYSGRPLPAPDWVRTQRNIILDVTNY